MAVDSSALTLSDWAAYSNDEVVKQITKSVHMTWNAIKDIPLVTSNQLKQTGVRFIGSEGMPSVTWTSINEEPTTTKAKPTAYEESIYLVRNKFVIDEMLLNQPTQITDPVQAQVDAWTMAFAYEFNDKFINNNPESGGTSAKCFPGLRYRLQNPTKFDIPSEMVVNASGVVMNGSMTASTANDFISYVDELLDNLAAPDGNGVVLYMSEKMKRQFAKAIRLLGSGAGFNTQSDGYDRMVDVYRNAKIRTVGRKVDQSTPIIANAETAPGTADSGGTFTSIYGVHYGDGYVTGWQKGLLKPEYLGKSRENGVIHNVVLNWGVGLWFPHTRSIGRIRNIGVS